MIGCAVPEDDPIAGGERDHQQVSANCYKEEIDMCMYVCIILVVYAPR